MGFWQDSHAATIDVARFRAHDQYLEQSALYPYAALVDWLNRESLVRLAQLGEDGAFGATKAKVGELTVSRDLLDSVLEIGFLERSGLDLDMSVILDIGAGYGRLAHRIHQTHPDAIVCCTDAIAVSREVCQRYLTYRHADAWVLTPEQLLNFPDFDLAVNVHSWSECTMPEVVWWLDMLGALKVPRLFIVPHNPTFGVWDAAKGGGNGTSYLPELERRGWKLEQRWEGPACSPRTYALFGRST